MKYFFKNYNKTKKEIALIILLFFISGSFAETVRLNSIEIMDVTYEKKSTTLKYANGLAIRINPEMDFLQGVEIEIKQGQASLNFPNSVEYQMYTCKQLPKEKILEYSGKAIEKKLLPSRLSSVVQFPTTEKNDLSSSAYAKLLPYTYKPDDGFILVRLQPIMKGLSVEFENAVFTITVKAIYTNEGGLKVNVKFPNTPSPIKLSLNENPVKLPEKDTFLKLAVGEYTLVLEAENYRTELRNIEIKQAEILKLDIDMRSIIPLLYVFVPDGVEVFLDREKIATQKQPIELSAKKHTLKLKLGTYEVLREINAEEGKTYTVTMDIDVDLKESE